VKKLEVARFPPNFTLLRRRILPQATKTANGVVSLPNYEFIEKELKKKFGTRGAW